MSKTRSKLSSLNTNVMPIIKVERKSQSVDSSDDEQSSKMHFFNGQYYSSYDDLVKAKRKRNEEVLANSGIFDVTNAMKTANKRSATQRGIRSDKKIKEETDSSMTTRRSNRLAGITSDGMYIEEERAGMKIKIGSKDTIIDPITNSILKVTEQEKYFKGRVNDGDVLTLKNAMELCASKWSSEGQVESAHRFMTSLSNGVNYEQKSKTFCKTNIDHISVDDPTCVVKIVPDRIYSVAFHPSPNKLISVAGDKEGYVGLWDVDHDQKLGGSDGVYLTKPHGGAVSNLEWNPSGSKLMSASYDSSVRLFDLEKESFTEVFATYDSSSKFEGRLGYGLDMGYKYWVQFVTFDPRNENCLFATTSFGDALHVDLRDKAHISWNEQLSEKKINTASLHPNGYTLATAGLDCTLHLWDIRRFQTKNGKSPVAVATYQNRLSINSAFFSPSGKNIVTTTMSNNLDIFSDAHLKSSSISSPTHRIHHDNMTGRWLTTFMAKWHPTNTQEELFVVGSMHQPRRIEVFDATKGKLVRAIQGESLSSVMSRCCFHPTTDQMILLGGNSSGRAIVAR